MKRYVVYSLFIIFAASSCSTVRTTGSNDDGRISFNIVQINDVYEIAPLANGTEGGMARIATIKKIYQERNPNTFLVMAGDFVSPSVYNSLKYEGKSIRGKQMIEVMNAAGMDIAIFGNHEFDIREAEIQERINESTFQWVSSNTFHKVNNKPVPFEKTTTASTEPFPVTYIKTIKDADGTTAKIGFIGLTLPFNKASYVSYTDAITTAKELYNKLKDSVDAVIALTHQSIEEDELLAKEVPGLAAIIGGHEHDQHFTKVGNVPITKAMANAKSVFIIHIGINKKNKSVRVRTKLEQVNDSYILDNTTDVVVQKWVSIAEKSFASLGFDAKKVALAGGEPLDGRESEVRSKITNLTSMIVAAIAYSTPKADLALMNAGSIRVDDILQMPITQYDIIRTLPFGGGIKEIDIKGGLLSRVIEQGVKNKGIGGFLHYSKPVAFDAALNSWTIDKVAIDPANTYRLALPDFLLTGGEANLDFLKTGNPDILKVYESTAGQTDPLADIRLVLIRYLERK